jgi:DNA-binding MarR family transcriptional regulator
MINKSIELESLFRSVFRKLKNEMRAILGQGLTNNEYILLKNLSRDTRMRSSELAVQMDVSASHITSVTDSLATKQLIIRDRSSLDRRVVELSITEAGFKIMNEIELKRSEYLREVFSILSPNEVDNLIFLFNKLMAR